MKKFAANGSGIIKPEEEVKSRTDVPELDNYSIRTYYNSDARKLDYLPDNCIDLILTSPPYNVGIKYNLHNDNMPREDYEQFVGDFLAEFYRVLKPGGRLAIVIANYGRNPYITNTILYTQKAEQIGFMKRGEIIWVKGDSPNGIAWGSFSSPSNPSLRDAHEYILVFHKENPRNQTQGTATISSEMFMSCSNSIWRINPTTKKKSGGHPAAFPPELAERLIQFYTYQEDIVLDPFCGSGTTCRVAEQLGRRWIGNDIDLSYINTIRQKENNKNNREVNKLVSTSKKKQLGLTPARIRRERLNAERQKRRKQKLIDQSEKD